MKKKIGDFGQQIRKLRRQKGWTQERLAEEVRISQTHLGEIERGRKIPGFFTFVELVICLDASADEILFEHREKNQSDLIARVEALPPGKREALFRVIEIFLEL